MADCYKRHRRWSKKGILDEAFGRLQEMGGKLHRWLPSYDMQARAVNSSGVGLWSETATATPASTTANTKPYFTQGDNDTTTSGGNTTTRTVAEHTPAGRAVGAAVAAHDTDSGDTLTYTLGGPDAARFTIATSTGQLSTKAALDHEVRPNYTVTVSVRDKKNSQGNTDTAVEDTITVNISVADVPGAVRLSTAAPQVGTTVTASIADSDGVTVGSAVWQWHSSADKTAWAVIPAAAAASYTPVAADAGS